MTWSHGRRVRQIVQIASLAFYLYLLLAALQSRAALPLADLFFRFDPLAALAAMLAARTWIPRFALALIVLGLTWLVGRVWCGWICPLGTLIEWISLRPARRRAVHLSPRWRMIKNVLLLVILAAALFGNLTLLVFDPLALLTHSMATVVLPAFNHVITSAEVVLYPIPFLRPALDGAENLLRGPILPPEQPIYENALIAGLFVGLLALNVFAARFWCRYLCPLGALLGLASKVSILRPVIGSACSHCARCARACQMDAIDQDQDQDYHIAAADCTVCLDCLATCPKGAVEFRWRWRPAPIHEYDPSRRQILAALAAGAVGVAVLRTGVQAKQHSPLLLRPPGVTSEPDFVSRCVRCSQCIKVCPSTGLQPALLDVGLEGLWTPQLVPRLGYCDYGCNACGQVCPSGAIPLLDLAAKRQAVIGVAVINRNRCLPWAQGVTCIVCEEMCPMPEKAIRLEEATMAGGRGQTVAVQRPYVLPDLCIGCGICEHQCPLEGEAAIRVYRR